MWVDSHCHLDFSDFADERDAVVARAGAAGVDTMLTIGTRLSRIDRVIAVAEAYPNVWCTVGVHPHEVAGEGIAAVDHLVRLAEHPKVVGFGETGLDFHYDHSPRDLQEASFRAHIEAARYCGLPVVIHSRNADAVMARVLAEEMANAAFSGVLHCFSSGAALARTAIDLGFFVSFSGILTFKKAKEVSDIAREIPVDRLLVETDAPYLAPVPHRGKRNEPAHTAITGQTLAELHGVAAATMAAATTANFFALFGRARRS
jgi:TatD DNase family protein